MRIYQIFSESCGSGMMTDNLISEMKINAVTYTRKNSVERRRGDSDPISENPKMSNLPKVT